LAIKYLEKLVSASVAILGAYLRLLFVLNLEEALAGPTLSELMILVSSVSTDPE
jgi:hypothetical protein